MNIHGPVPSVKPKARTRWNSKKFTYNHARVHAYIMCNKRSLINCERIRASEMRIEIRVSLSHSVIVGFWQLYRVIYRRSIPHRAFIYACCETSADYCIIVEIDLQTDERYAALIYMLWPSRGVRAILRALAFCKRCDID